jgi:large subunit ribosomal protein L25
MEKLNLNVEKRDTRGKGAARELRRRGFTPAVIYRAGESLPVQIAARELSRFINKTSGEQVLVTLDLADGSRQAILKEYQKDPLSCELLHVDFQEILATEEIEISVHIVTTGECIGVKRDKGMLQYGIREIDIKCLPDKIPGHIIVDVTELTLGKTIYVKDLTLGEGVKVLTDPGKMIVGVIAVKEEVVVAPEAAAETPEGAAAAAAAGTAAASGATPEPEVLKKGKKAEEAAE